MGMAVEVENMVSPGKITPGTVSPECNEMSDTIPTATPTFSNMIYPKEHIWILPVYGDGCGDGKTVTWKNHSSHCIRECNEMSTQFQRLHPHFLTWSTQGNIFGYRPGMGWLWRWKTWFFRLEKSHYFAYFVVHEQSKQSLCTATTVSYYLLITDESHKSTHWNCIDMCTHSWDAVLGVIFPGRNTSVSFHSHNSESKATEIMSECHFNTELLSMEWFFPIDASRWKFQAVCKLLWHWFYCSTGLGIPQNLGLVVGITLIFQLYSKILQVEWFFQVEASFSSTTSIPLLERYPAVFHWLDRGRKCGCSHWNCVNICTHSWDTVPGVIFPGRTMFFHNHNQSHTRAMSGDAPVIRSLSIMWD